jgi:UDPglucose 6-dehydrogenase
MSRIAIFGAGYVGLVTGACLADLGHEVAVRDILPDKIDALRRGEVPIYEPGLEELLARNAERLHFTLDVREALDGAEFAFVCVDTPPLYSGDADLSRVWTVVDELPPDTRTTIVMKSTVPVGTGEKVRAELDSRGLARVGYVSNPEFTAEGTAVRDFMEPDRIVVGAFDDADGEAVERLHVGIDAPVVRADVNSAEMIKLAANAFLMTRVSFINEIANVCELVGADVHSVAQGIGLDHRLGPHFLRAGLGYGGSCLDGRETVLARAEGRVWLTTLERLFAELAPAGSTAQALRPEKLEVLSWDPEDKSPRFMPVEAVTCRPYRGDMLEVRTKMGRRLRCTSDHPFVVADSTGAGIQVKLAEDLTEEDWLPIAQQKPAGRSRTARFEVLAGMAPAGIDAESVIVRPDRRSFEVVDHARLRTSLQEVGALNAPARAHDIRRAGALRLHEAQQAEIGLHGASYATARNGTYVPNELAADEKFWRIVGLYIAEGYTSADGARRRICWSFHPRKEFDLVEDVLRFWRLRGVKAVYQQAPTAANVCVSSRLLAGWWLGVLGLGANCYEQRLPDSIWAAPEAHKRALLAGLWRGDGSWSFVAAGPSVTLEYGTVSREAADGILRLLGELGVVASLRVGRTSKSTCDTYWLRISGADQVEQMLDLVAPDDGEIIRASLARQAKRIAPTGYRRHHDHAAWVRVVDVTRVRSSGFVYSLEVPGPHTVVTTGGLVVHNCFPKDSLALKQLAANSGYHFQLLTAVIEVNELQKRRVIQKLQKHLGRLRGKTVALLGLAFKPNTDDTREAPSLVLASRLLAEGAEVRTWDPIAVPELQGVKLFDTPLEAVTGADAAVIVTEWPQLAELASEEVRAAMRHPLIIDGRNLLDPAAVRAAGFAYEGIGRAVSPLDVLPETPEREPEPST